MAAHAYRFATRLNSFRAGRSGVQGVADALDTVAKVPGLNAVELNFPQHFQGDGESPIDLARARGLDVTALNLRFDGPAFAEGAFTHPLAANRQAAIDLSIAAVDAARDAGIDHVIIWPGPDGYDYPFHVDYVALFRLTVEGFQRVGEHDRTTRISLEYKPSDPRRMSLIRTMAESLLVARDTGCPNVGVTLDLCHALMAGESPAAAAALAIREGRLFGVHLNDGYGPADDGLLVGSVHPWHLLELLWTLRRGHFNGTIYFDTFPERVDPAGECAANIRTIRRFERMLDRMGRERLAELQAAQDALGVNRLVQDLMWGHPHD